MGSGVLLVNRIYRHFAPTALLRAIPLRSAVIGIMFTCIFVADKPNSAQTRRRPSTSKPAPQQQAPRASATKYSAFLHSPDKHKSLACNACHKIPTAWNAKRDFPDVADFPDHNACVRCHRQQFFTRQAMIGTGPTICTVCHVRAAPREDARFAFGRPNSSGQALKSKDEREFAIEFPHDKHQNAIADRGQWNRLQSVSSELHHGLKSVPLDDRKPDYNNCSI